MYGSASFYSAYQSTCLHWVLNHTNPNTGYGYIQYEQLAVSDNIFKVKTFTEKPDLELAKTFVASGDFLWNAGIFVWQVKNII